MYNLRPREFIKNKYTEDLNIDDLQLSNNYFDSIFTDILKLFPDLVNNNSTMKLYFIRIWLEWSNKYVYKIGSATNIYSRIKQINSKYGCCGKIIIISLCEIPNQIFEKKIHNILDNYKIKESDLVNPIKPQPKEFYYLNPILPTKLYNLLLGNVKYLYINSKYKIYKSYYYLCEELIDVNILLDRGEKEEEYWDRKRLNLKK